MELELNDSNRLNIYAMLCEDVTDDPKSFINVYDTLELNDENSMDFKIVLFSNTIGICGFKTQVHIQYVKDLDGNLIEKGMLVGELNIPPLSGENCSSREKVNASFPGSNGVYIINMKNMKFPGKGEYSILITYKERENNEKVQKEENIQKEDENWKLASTSYFKVL